jgi:hypothetical protein
LCKHLGDHAKREQSSLTLSYPLRKDRFDKNQENTIIAIIITHCLEFKLGLSL